MSKLYNGLQAALRGAWEAGCDNAYGITETSKSWDTGTELAWQECVDSQSAFHAALGCAVAGKRSVAVVDTLDCADLTTVAHVGVNAACCVIVVDNGLRPYFDWRLLAEGAHVPMMMPPDVYECKTYTKIACNLSEKYDTPVLVYIGPTVWNTRTAIVETERKVLRDMPFVRNVEKYVVLPSSLRLCAEDMVVRDRRLSQDCESFPIHAVEYRDKSIGVVCCGEVYHALLQGVPHASVLRLGMVYPLPMQLLRDFAASVEDCVVLEEGEPIVERAMIQAGIVCHGKDVFALRTHYTPDMIAERLLGVSGAKADDSLPIRTPAFCTDCPLIDLFEWLKNNHCIVHADVGCGMLGATVPMLAVDTAICTDPIAFGNGFATKSPCVSVVNSRHLLGREEKLNGCHVDNTVVVWGNTSALEGVLQHIGLAYERIDKTTWNGLWQRCHAGILLYAVETGC